VLSIKRTQQREINRKAISKAYLFMSSNGLNGCGYKAVVGALTFEGYLTSRGNLWTPKRLFRMLQREGISGLHGLKRYGRQASLL
jgi:hypothetical protein